MKISYFLIILPLLVTSCNLVQYHPYEMVNNGEKHLTDSNISLIQSQTCNKDTIRFIFITDTQRDYDDTRDAVDYINSLQGIDFVLHGGDLTDFGLADEFDWMTNILCKLKVPFLTVIGNHDFLGVGEHNYQHIYGSYNWSMNAGHIHIIGLNTNSREQEYSMPIPDFSFLYSDIQSIQELNILHPDSITHTILLMHARPKDEQFNNNVIPLFKSVIHQYPGLEETSPRIISTDKYENIEENIIGSHRYGFAVNGHNHRHELLRLLDDDLLFYGCPDIKSRELFLFTIYPDGYFYEAVHF